MVSLPLLMPSGYSEACCVACHAALFVSRLDGPLVCRVCERGETLREAQRLVVEVRSLLRGESPFDVLSPAGRAEQLAALMTDDPLIGLCGNESAPPELLAIASQEILRRLGWSEPSPAERRALEEDRTSSALSSGLPMRLESSRKTPAASS